METLFFRVLFLNMLNGLFFFSFSLEGLSATKIPPAREIDVLETKLLTLINCERTKQGLPSLSKSQLLSYYAKEHSQNMANKTIKFGHDGFEARAEAIKREGRHLAFGENVAYNYLADDPLQTAFDGWMKSAGHRQNILGNFNETGIGICYDKEGRCYLTQLFSLSLHSK